MLLEFLRTPVSCDGKDPPHPPYHAIWHKGWACGHDIPSVRRGYEVYRQVCSTCHSMKFKSFRQLTNQVYPEARVKQIASSYDVWDGPNEEGEMFQRPGILTDAFPLAYPNDEAAAYSNGGAIPPDLSIFTAARHEGVDYTYSLLTGYRDPPYGIHLRAGLYYNSYFPGGAISMPPPLTEDGQVDYEDKTPSTISQMALDVTNFLTWATEPTHDERKILGLKMVSAMCVGAVACGYWNRAYFIAYKTRRIDFTKVRL